ncbi:MAG: AAA family ATPase [Chthonomonas sp.]|nr:AAA family ATPase [Chthonomonas sp.]
MSTTLQLPNNQIRITGIDIRSFKRVRAFSLTLDEGDNLVTIGGENANGKSSVLDAIENALCGVPRTQTMPVHSGAQGAGIKVTIPPYQVKRLFDANGKPNLEITRLDDGTKVPNPQQFLNDLIGGMFVDPLDFIAKQPIEQRRILADLVGLDMDAIDKQIEDARSRQSQLDEHQKRLIARVGELPWHDDAPDAEVSVADLSQELQRILDHNNTCDQARNATDLKRQEITGMEDAIDRSAAEIQRLKRQLEEAESRLKTQEANLAEHRRLLGNLEMAAHQMVKQDPTAIQNQMAGVEEANRKFRDNQAKLAGKDEWTKAEAELGQAIQQVTYLQSEKKRMLSEANFPVPGLAFNAKEVTLNEIPFRQASHAEQVRASVGIALAMRGQLGLILIRDASTVDKKTLRLIADEAAQRGAQVFAEVVANLEEEGFDRQCSIYIHDGANTELGYRELSGVGA